MEYCKTCGEPLFQTVKLLQGEVEVARMCACERERNDEAILLGNKLEETKRIIKARERCFENERYASLDFVNDRNPGSKESNIAFNYAENFSIMKEKGKGLLIFGKPDASKTFYSACIANYLLEMGFSVIMEKPARIIAKVMSRNYRDDYISQLAKVDLLILDDFGTESGSEFRQEVMYDVIDSRFKRPLIVTTNLTKEEILNPSSVSQERVFGRILDGCMPVEFEQKNMRWSRDYSDMVSILQ